MSLTSASEDSICFECSVINTTYRIHTLSTKTLEYQNEHDLFVPAGNGKTQPRVSSILNLLYIFSVKLRLESVPYWIYCIYFLRLWEDGWKDRYYKSKFDVEADDIAFRHNVVSFKSWLLIQRRKRYRNRCSLVVCYSKLIVYRFSKQTHWVLCIFSKSTIWMFSSFTYTFVVP